MSKKTTHANAERAIVTAPKKGRLLFQLISPGWGSSGYYAPAVLAEAAQNGLFPKGLHMYADHPTEEDARKRPERSVRDLMGVLAEDATITADGSITAEIQVTPEWADLPVEIWEQIGVSILGSATDITRGEAEGRVGNIIEGLASIDSVDFVTRAGRGGKLLAVLESARISEATSSETRSVLQTAVGDAYRDANDDQSWVWVRDFDETRVWFEVDSSDTVWEQSYELAADGTAQLLGERIEVRVSLQYVPVDPAGRKETKEVQGGHTMAQIQIEESEHSRLLTEAGRVTTLEAERDTERARRETAEQALESERQATRNANAARGIIGESDVDFDELQTRGLLADLPVTQEGALDGEAFTATVEKFAAKVKESRGAGSVGGFGWGDNLANDLSEADLDAAIENAFGPVKG